MSTTMPETEDAGIHIHWTEPHHQLLRDVDGDPRWCFSCRAKHAFVYIVLMPVGMSYYGPIRQIQCSICGTVDGDCFPGTEREWSD